MHCLKTTVGMKNEIEGCLSYSVQTSLDYGVAVRSGEDEIDETGSGWEVPLQVISVFVRWAFLPTKSV